MCLSIAVEHPDRVLESGEFHGFEYAITHNGIGYRCGYVRLPLGHCLHGAGLEADLDVHGGISFAEADMPCEKPGADADWWLGFDCAHGGDACDLSLPFESEAGKDIARSFRYGEVRQLDYLTSSPL